MGSRKGRRDARVLFRQRGRGLGGGMEEMGTGCGIGFEAKEVGIRQWDRGQGVGKLSCLGKGGGGLGSGIEDRETGCASPF